MRIKGILGEFLTVERRNVARTNPSKQRENNKKPVGTGEGVKEAKGLHIQESTTSIFYLRPRQRQQQKSPAILSGQTLSSFFHTSQNLTTTPGFLLLSIPGECSRFADCLDQLHERIVNTDFFLLVKKEGEERRRGDFTLCQHDNLSTSQLTFADVSTKGALIDSAKAFASSAGTTRCPLRSY